MKDRMWWHFWIENSEDVIEVWHLLWSLRCLTHLSKSYFSLPALCFAKYLSLYCFFFLPNQVQLACCSCLVFSMAMQATRLAHKESGGFYLESIPLVLKVHCAWSFWFSSSLWAGAQGIFISKFPGDAAGPGTTGWERLLSQIHRQMLP